MPPVELSTPDKGSVPMRCSKCVGESYYGRLDIPSTRRRPCPNCGAKLVPVQNASEGSSRDGRERTVS